MTLFKISIKNLKMSMKNYLIYFTTIILGVAIFYVFNAISSQKILIDILADEREIIDVIEEGLSGVSIFVAIVLGFLIVYASTFLMKRRKKEFGIYMTLGMGKRKISYVLVIETLLIGAISLVIGLMLGIAASQGMSIVIVNMFEADMTNFEFQISSKAISKTILYFVIMYLVVIVLNVFIVGKTKLINLLNSSKKAQKNTMKNPYICFIVFVISVILLATAYYSVTAGMDEIKSAKEFLMQIIKGIIGTFGFFWSFGGFLITICKSSKKFYHHKLNSFTVNELSSRVNTTVFAGGIICLMLFFTITMMSCSLSLKKSIDDGLEKYAPRDLQYVVYTQKKDCDLSAKELLENNGIDTSHFDEIYKVPIYRSRNNYYFDDDDLEEGEIYVENKEHFPNISRRIHLSDYNELAKALNLKEIELKDDEYAIIANYDYFVGEHSKKLKNGTCYYIRGQEFKPAYDKCVEGFLYLSSTADDEGFVVLPDNVNISEDDENTILEMIYADYDTNNKKKIKKYEKTYVVDIAKTEDDDETKATYIYTISRRIIFNENISLTLLLVFVGLYIGSVFMISGAAVLALKILSEAIDNKDKYIILRKIGTDNKLINKSLLCECSICFGLPMLLAIVHSIFGIKLVTKILIFFGNTGLMYSIIVTAVIIILIYGGYALLTYLCAKKIIDENS